ncbi:MAG: hypothetical protein ACUVS2_10380 [Candidatus Flexifilum sp.]|jgi:hypothetical protein
MAKINCFEQAAVHHFERVDAGLDELMRVQPSDRAQQPAQRIGQRGSHDQDDEQVAKEDTHAVGEHALVDQCPRRSGVGDPVGRQQPTDKDNEKGRKGGDPPGIHPHFSRFRRTACDAPTVSDPAYAGNQI